MKPKMRQWQLVAGGAAALVLLVAVAALAMPSNDVVRLPGGQSITGSHTWTLKDIVWNKATNQVSALLVYESVEEISGVVAPKFEVGTYDHTQLPLRIDRHPIAVQPVLDPTATKLVWTISNFRMPVGEKFAGVYLSDGSYRRGTGPAAEPRKLFITLATAHDQW